MTVFARAQYLAGTDGTDPATRAITPTAATSLLLAVLSERSGTGHTPHTMGDNGATGADWVKVFGRDQALADGNARHSFSVWGKVAGSTAAIVASGDDGTSNGKLLSLHEYTTDTAGTWSVVGTPATADTGTGSTSPLAIGPTGSAAAGDNLVVAFINWRTQSDQAYPGSATNSFTGLTTTGAGSNGRQHGTAWKQDAGGGTFSTSIDWSGSGHEAAGGIAVFKLSGAGDETAPVLSSPSASATGSATATGGVTTDEAGPAWAVVTTSATTPTGTQIAAGEDHTGSAAAAADSASLSIGANAGVFDFAGLAASTGYYMHVVQDDTASPANTATPVTSAQFTTDEEDTTAPILSDAAATATGATTATGGVTTDEAGPAWAVLTTSATTPTGTQIAAGQDHTGTAAAASNTAALSIGANDDVFAFAGLVAETTYYMHVVQNDEADPANTATPISSASITTEATPPTEDIEVSALLFPGKYSDDANARMKLTGSDVPNRFAGTFMAHVKFNQHDSYYGFLALADDIGVGNWSGGHYEYLATPYATDGSVDAEGLFLSASGGAVHYWEIGGHTPLGESTSQDRGAAAGGSAILVRKGVWLKVIGIVDVVNISGTDYERHRLWPDIELYPDTAIVGYKPVADFPTPTNPTLAIGAYKWAPQTSTSNDEPLDGYIRGLRIVKGAMSLANAKLELAAAERGTEAWATTEAASFGGTILDNPTVANVTSTNWEWDNDDRPADHTETITVPVDESASGAPASVSLIAPAATAGGAALASGSPASAGLVAALGSASGGTAANASASPAAVSLVAPVATATAAAVSTGAPAAVSITAPHASANGGTAANASASPAAITLAAPVATAGGAAVVSAVWAGIALVPAPGAATGAAAASGGLAAVSTTPPAASANGSTAGVGSGSPAAITLQAPSASGAGAAHAGGGFAALGIAPATGTAESTAGASASGTPAAMYISAAPAAASGSAVASAMYAGLTITPAAAGFAITWPTGRLDPAHTAVVPAVNLRALVPFANLRAIVPTE